MKGALGPSKCLFGSVLLGKNNFSSVSVGAQEEAWLAGMAEWGLEPPFSARVCVMPARYRHSPPDPLAESLAWRARSVLRTPQSVSVQASLRITWCLPVVEGSSHLTCHMSA